jgi:hypothetical protein
MAMIRKQLYLPAHLDRELMAEAKRRDVSQAELIRLRLTGRDTPARHASTPVDEKRRQEALRALRKIYRVTKEGPGSGQRFNREELYAERLAKVGPR